MKIFYALLLKDLKLFTFRRHYLVFSMIVGFSTMLAMFSGYSDYSRRLESYSQWREIQSESLSQLTYSDSLRGPGYSQSFKPTPYSILVRGSEDLITATFETREWTKQFFGNLQNNSFLAGLLPRFDYATMLILIFPVLMAFLLADFIRDEIDGKTLINTRIFGVKTFTFLASKLISSFLMVGLVSFLSLLAGFAIVFMVQEDLSGIGMRFWYFLLASQLYLLFWISVLLIPQICLKNRLSSISLSMLLWLTLVFVLPALHIHELNKVERPGSAKDYFQRKREVLLQRFENYDYVKEVPMDQHDPVSEIVRFNTSVEREMINCSKCTVPDLHGDTLYTANFRNKPLAWLSPTFITVTVLSEIAMTGGLDYTNFRKSMFDYYLHLVSVWSLPELRAWILSYEPHPPVEQLKKLNVEFKRVPLTLTIENLFPLQLILGLNIILSLFLFFAIGARVLRVVQ